MAGEGRVTLTVVTQWERQRVNPFPSLQFCIHRSGGGGDCPWGFSMMPPTAISVSPGREGPFLSVLSLMFYAVTSTTLVRGSGLGYPRLS